MTLQMVGEVKYAPSRDIVYLYPDVIKAVADRMEDEKFGPLHEWLKECGVTMDDLGAAIGCYCEFLNKSHQDPDQTMWDVLNECGWNDCKWEAQVAVMFYTGILMTGTFFKGVRDVVPLGGSTVTPVQELIHAGRQLDMYMSMSPWKRWLFGKWKWTRRFIRRGKSLYSEV